MNTVIMKLTAAIVVGGEVVNPPALVEVTLAEGADLARRGKAVPATQADAQPTARTPSAEAAAPDLAALRAAYDAAVAEQANTAGKSAAQKKADKAATAAALKALQDATPADSN